VVTRKEALAHLTARGMPHELRASDMPGGWTLRTFVNAPPTLRELYCEARSDRDFLVYDELRLSFEQTWREACRLAHALFELGVRRGDRVAIAMRNYPEWVIAYMAATSMGAIAVALNALWKPEEMEYGLNHSGSSLLICDEERLERLQGCTPPAGLKVIAVRTRRALPAGVLRYEDVMNRPEMTSMPAIRGGPDDDAVMYFTSGSTGHPKAAVSTHRAVVTAMMSWELDLFAGIATGVIPAPLPNAPQHVTLLAIPLFHVTGSHAVFLMSFRLQRRMVLMYKWDAAKAVDLVEREQVTAFTGTPAITGDLVVEARRQGRPLPTLKTVGGGGASRAPEQVRAIDAVFENAAPNTGWGMTETNAIGVGIQGSDYLTHPESSGRLSAVMDMRIVDEQGREVPVGERGELQVRGSPMMREYWNRPDANAESFDGPWFRTGDVARIDEDGFLYIVDRIKDLVIRGGENIGCGPVEYALQEHPAVLEACVYGVPDERLGEEVGATVYVERPVTAAELQAFLEPRIASFQIPRYIDIVTEPLPRGATGKIFKREIRAVAVARMGLAQAS
jgi:long-chain acyl-CoA synthetase